MRALLPVIRAAMRDDRFQVRVLALNTAAPFLRARHIPVLGLVDFADAGIYATGIPYAHSNHRGMGISFRESAAYYGFCVTDFLRRYDANLLDAAITHYNRRLFFPLETAERIIRREKPDAIITTNNHRFELAMAYAGSRLGIPVFRIEDFMGEVNPPLPDPGFSLGSARETNLNPVLADYGRLLTRPPVERFFIGCRIAADNVSRQNV